MDINILKEKIIKGHLIDKDEALNLINANLDELKNNASKIREYFCGNGFDICTIINAKSGKCSEDCKFCAQSKFYNTAVKVYGLLDKGTIVEDAIKQYNSGILRYSLVSSGKNLTDSDIEKVCEIVKEIKTKVPLNICISGGLISEEGFKKLKDAGVTRVHNNLESSSNYFKEICSTHTHDQKIKAIKNAKNAGMEICSGGIIGLGESFEDRIDLAFELRELGITSIPINVLNPIPNTPLENNEILSQDDIDRTVAIFRFILPRATIRLAGGRALMKDMGKTAFQSGANAAISGDMLTTYGISVENDKKLLKDLDFKIKLMV